MSGGGLFFSAARTLVGRGGRRRSFFHSRRRRAEKRQHGAVFGESHTRKITQHTLGKKRRKATASPRTVRRCDHREPRATSGSDKNVPAPQCTAHEVGGRRPQRRPKSYLSAGTGTTVRSATHEPAMTAAASEGPSAAEERRDSTCCTVSRLAGAARLP